METLCTVLLCVGSVFIVVGFLVLVIYNKIVALLVPIGLFLVLTSAGMNDKINKGNPASLDALITGEKYEVIAMCDEEYIVIKSLADENKIRLIGPLNFDTTSVGVGDVCIKTAEGSLKKFLRH